MQLRDTLKTVETFHNIGGWKKNMQSPNDDSPYGQEHSVGHTL